MPLLLQSMVLVQLSALFLLRLRTERKATESRLIITTTLLGIIQHICQDYPNVPTQLEAAIRAKKRQGSDAVELFGMYFDQLLPYAQEWIKENGDTKDRLW
jgi:hypothetical protein